MRYREEIEIVGCHGFGVTSNEKISGSYQTVLGDYRKGSVPARGGIEEKIRALIKQLDAIDQDPKVGELGEEYRRKYGTLTEEDLRKTFTI